MSNFIVQHYSVIFEKHETAWACQKGMLLWRHYQLTATYILHAAADTDTGCWRRAIGARLGCVWVQFRLQRWECVCITRTVISRHHSCFLTGSLLKYSGCSTRVDLRNFTNKFFIYFSWTNAFQCWVSLWIRMISESDQILNQRISESDQTLNQRFSASNQSMNRYDFRVCSDSELVSE